MLARLAAHAVRRLLHRVGYRMAPLCDADVLEPVLNALLRRKGMLTFVQIGANDGQHADPLFRFIRTNHRRMRGLVLEPLPDLFKKLQAAYRPYPQIVPVRVAIHNTETEMTMYRVDPRAPGVRAWSQGIASFDPTHHTRSNIAVSCIITERVPCTTLPALLHDYGLTEIDLLQIDAEGYDAAILLDLDFARIHPRVIHFEHGLPQGVMDLDTFQRVLAVLYAQGYAVSLSEYDATAYQYHLFMPGVP